jgi:hypothetical protein
VRTAGRARALMDAAERAWDQGALHQVLEHMRELRALPGHGQLPEVVDAWKHLRTRCEPAGVLGSRPALTLRGHHTEVHALTISADGAKAWSTDGHGIIHWDLETGSQRSMHALDRPARP